MDKKEILQNLYQIQEFMNCDIFDASPFENEEKNEILNNNMYIALNKAIELLNK
tara:strand:- start:469 stop:630 length:162 start_codon:yes stop_codon:yes gene_type:complete